MTEIPLRVTYFRVQILFPPVMPRFTGAMLPELYLEISHHHFFEKWELVGGDQGAVLSSEGIKDCHILRDRIILAENIQTSFDLVVKNFQDIVEIVKKKLNLPILVGFQSLIRALWPLPEPENAPSFLQSRIFNINKDQYNLLGMSIAGTGIKVNCVDLPRRVHDFKVEPFFRDPRNVFIELESTLPEPIQTLEVLKQKMEESYGFLTVNIVNFLKSFGLPGGM